MAGLLNAIEPFGEACFELADRDDVIRDGHGFHRLAPYLDLNMDINIEHNKGLCKSWRSLTSTVDALPFNNLNRKDARGQALSQIRNDAGEDEVQHAL
jgi:hypothetical protein